MPEHARPATLEDLKQLARSLDEQGAPYLLIGGYALLAHGYPRATVDIDLLVPSNRAAAEAVRQALLVLPDGVAAQLDPAWFEEGEGIRVADEITVGLVFRTCGEAYESLKPFEQVVDLDGVVLRTKQSDRARDASDRALRPGA